MGKPFKTHIYSQLQQDIEKAYQEAEDGGHIESRHFDAKSGAFKEGKHMAYLVPKSFTETISFYADTATYTVYNTKTHIRILAWRLGIKLVDTGYQSYPVWTGCNGYMKAADKQKLILVEEKEGYLPIYALNASVKPTEYYVLFLGKMLFMGRHYSPPNGIPLSTLVDVCLKANAQVSVITQELIDRVKQEAN